MGMTARLGLKQVRKFDCPSQKDVEMGMTARLGLKPHIANAIRLQGGTSKWG